MKILLVIWNKAMVRVIRLRMINIIRNKIICMERTEGTVLVIVLSSENRNEIMVEIFNIIFYFKMRKCIF